MDSSVSTKKLTARRGSTKYGPIGKCSGTLFKDFKLSAGSLAALTDAGDHGLAKSTWSTYNTAERLLAMCSKQRNKTMDLPLSEESLLEFVGWLLEVRKVKAGTVNSYLSGLRQLHILKGMDPPQIRSHLMKFVLKGRKNKDNIEERKTGLGKRLPMTMTMMRLLKESIRLWDVPISQKLLMWSVATMAFHGAFRIHELLCQIESEFDPDFALLTGDVKILPSRDDKMTRILEVKLKSPKENRSGKAVIIEIYETKGTLCPVKAFERWAAKVVHTTGLPLFRGDTGTPLTGAKLNRWLHGRLEGYVDFKKGTFTSHSFRIGLATTMATMGFNKDDIKEAGRWSSNAYKVYMKLPHVKRARIAKMIKDL